MSGAGPVEKDQPGVDPIEQARHGLEQAEAGDQTGAEQLEQARKSDPAAAEAAEQEAADAPEGLGQSR